MFWILPFLVTSLATYYLLDQLIRSKKVKGYSTKYVYVTGCDSGFGKELVQCLDSLGFNVFAGCLTEEGKQYLSKNCSNRVLAILHDVSNAESCQMALKTVQENLPPDAGLWGLVNNAGISGNMAPSELCDKDEYLKVMAVNLVGLIDTTRVFLPLIRKAGGRVVNMASAAGRIAFCMPPYSVSKFGVEAYSDILRRELYGRGVRVILIEPGAYITNIFNTKRLLGQVKAAYEKTTEEVKMTYGDIIGKFEAGVATIMKSGSANTRPVIDAYLHSLTSSFPRTRYTVGSDAMFTYIPVSYLPTWISDWLLQYV
ncbi:retinol dehydrogenase 7-like [Physella acuta]|uniref:retinol dehydrogenase 7-like n=1 Tax=Physella acuta TaxID=109671 RepID=UPI0027DD710F|nr:retinol dehydrogenase 7-like [Physella acuta]XP_059139304.1 retinol dehydrogenase 7-like [Physella acuta]